MMRMLYFSLVKDWKYDQIMAEQKEDLPNIQEEQELQKQRELSLIEKFQKTAAEFKELKRIHIESGISEI